jgi:PRTRC genetic system protein C
MLLVNNVKRVFIFEEDGKRVELPDPSAELTPKQVLDHYCAHYPELTTGTVAGPTIKDGVAQYEFASHLGNKG